jgi:hypothetical protein
LNKKFLIKIALSLLLCTSLFADTPLAPLDSFVSTQLDQLPLRGTLKQRGGFVYVDLHDGYIYKLHDYLEEMGYETPPYFEGERSAGAHITAIYPTEIPANLMIEECGEEISFAIIGCTEIEPQNWKEMKLLYLLVVEAPRLDEIRRSYGLLPMRYPFHITVGAIPRHAKAA